MKIVSRATQDVDDGTSNETARRFETIAQCWRHPDERLETALRDGLFTAELSALPSLDDLRLEHTRLFVGPGEHPCPPYESVYRDREGDQRFGRVQGPSTDDVAQWYREYGLATDESWTALPDHVAVELEFAGFLAATDPGALERFLDEHPREWLPEFLDGVESATREPFYAVLAAATRELLDDDGANSRRPS